MIVTRGAGIEAAVRLVSSGVQERGLRGELYDQAGADRGEKRLLHRPEPAVAIQEAAAGH